MHRIPLNWLWNHFLYFTGNPVPDSLDPAPTPLEALGMIILLYPNEKWMVKLVLFSTVNIRKIDYCMLLLNFYCRE